MTDAHPITWLAFAVFLLPFGAAAIAGAWAIFDRFFRDQRP